MTRCIRALRALDGPRWPESTAAPSRPALALALGVMRQIAKL